MCAMPESPTQPDPSPTNLPGEPPERLRAGLQRAYSAGTARVDANVDAAILAAARDHLRRRRLDRHLVGRLILVGGGLAAAAGLALAAIIIASNRPGATHPATPIARAAGPDDLNGDGRLDILDALALSNAIRAGRPARDLNADGRHDAADVDALALRIVDLGGAG